MKVTCIKLVNPNTGKVEKKNSWLTIGHTYHVLSVEKGVSDSIQYRLLGDTGHLPALHDAEQFEVISDKLPSNWVVGIQQRGSFELAPKKWMTLGYWERYFDGDVEAVKVFEEETKRILADDP